MIKSLKVPLIIAGLSFSMLTFSVAQQSEVVVPKLDKKVSRASFLRDKLTDHTVGYVRIPTQFGMAFSIKDKNSDRVMVNNANEKIVLHLKKVLQDPSLVNEALQQYISMPLNETPIDLGKLTSMIYTSVDGPIEIMANDMNKMLSPATQLLVSVPVSFSSAKELDEAVKQLFRQDIGLENHDGFYPLSESALMYFDAQDRRLFISLGQKALSKERLKELVDSLKITKSHRMYAYENQIDLSGQNLLVWAEIAGSRDMAAMLVQQEAPIFAEFLQNTEGFAFGVGAKNKLGHAKFISKTNTQKVSALKDFAKPLDFKTVGEPKHLAVMAVPSKQTMITFLKQNDNVTDEDLSKFEQQAIETLSFNPLDLLDIFGPKIIAYQDETGGNLALGIQNKAAFSQLINDLTRKGHVVHKVEKGLHELKISNPLFDLMGHLGSTINNNPLERLATEYGLVQPMAAEIVSAIYGIRALDVNYYLYWNEEQDWIVINTLPYSLTERNKAKISVAKWMEDQGIHSSGIVLSYTGEMKGAEERWYRDYLKFMRNNHDLLGQKFDLFSMPAPSSLKFNPTSRIGGHLSIDNDWVVYSLDYDISPFYMPQLFMGQGGVMFMGMMSSFAIPAYQDYTKRTYVAEGLALSAAAKLAVTETYITTGKWANNNEEAGLPDADVITSQAVDGIQVLEDGLIVIYFNDNVQYEGYLALNGIETPEGTVEWICYETNLANKYLPAQCRSDLYD